MLLLSDCLLGMLDLMSSNHDTEGSRGHESGVGPDGEAVLFNAGVRALSSFGFSEFSFDIGGKKSRRRYVAATSPTEERCSVWIKSTLIWHGMADVLRFPWSKRVIQADDLGAVLFAVDGAIRRGGTHLLAVVRDAPTGRLAIARLYTLEQVAELVRKQKALCRHPFYVTHGAALIIRAHHDAFAEAEAAALAFGEGFLVPGPPHGRTPPAARAQSSAIYKRDAKVRDAVLKMAGGRCERCGQQSFLTTTGEYYLETHHVVELSERGPDAVGNIIAVCPNCHRQAHFAADRAQVERDFMQAIRRRGSKGPRQTPHQP